MKTLLELLKYRFQLAEGFTKDFHKQVEDAVKDYQTDKDGPTTLETVLNMNSRYDYKVPYIFATHESMLASFFDQIPGLIFKGRGMEDQEKKEKVEAAYDYLIDILDVSSFMNTTAWWFLLTGYTSGHAVYKQSTKEVPIIDETTGEPMINEMGEQETRIEYLYDDPVLTAGEPLKEYFSPESEFSEDADKVPYYFRKYLMEVDEVKDIFGVKVEADASLEAKGTHGEPIDDIKRAKIYFYYGRIPSSNKKEVKGWEYDADYYIVYCNKKVIHKEKQDGKLCRIGKWFGPPNKFFGFGIGKTLEPFQRELSIRRGQQVRYADIAAYPKIAVDLNFEFGHKELLDPRENIVLPYSEQPPTYMTPPPMSETVLIAEDKAREDAQFVSGMLDISTGAQNSKTVDTATGQTIFAEAAEKRIRQAKRQYGRFFKEIMTLCLKLAQQNWEEEKVVSIRDTGGDRSVTVTKEDLSDIDFDKDIDIDIKSVSVNREVLRAQALEMYDRVKDDPMVDREMVFKKMLRDGYSESNPDQYIARDQEMVEDAGIIPNSEGGPVPSSQAAILGNE